MQKQKITAHQLFSLIVLFNFGTAIVVTLGLDAKQDAWIAILLGMFAGCLLYCLYLYLYFQYPSFTLSEYTEIILGKYVGKLLVFFYVLYFIYGAARDLRDLGELLVSSILNETPITIVMGFMAMLICYAILLGIEVFARTSEVLLRLLSILLLIFVILLMISKKIDTNNIKPILDNGLAPIIKTVWNVTWIFPFGEMICFTMLLPFLNNKKAAVKTGLIAIIFSGSVLSFFTMLNIMVLGVSLASIPKFPFLFTISTINIGSFIQGLNPIAIFTLVISVFVKVGMFFLAALLSCASLFEIKKINKLTALIGFIIFISSIVIASDYAEHIKEGHEVSIKFIHFPFAVCFPILIFIIHIIGKNSITLSVNYTTNNKNEKN